MKLDSPTLALICDLISQGESFDGAAKICACSRRSIYNYIDNSRRARAGDENISGTVTHKLILRNNHPQYTEIIPSVYFFRWKGELSWFDLHIQKALALRDPFEKNPECADMSDAEMLSLGYALEERYLHDDEGNRIPIGEEPEPPMGDIQDLRAMAHAEPTREKQRPTHPIEIFRGSRPNDPPERIGGAKPDNRTQVEREQQHPRAAPEGWSGPPLHAPPRPSYARPAPLDTYDPTGAREPPTDMRSTTATRTVQRSEIYKHGPLRVWDGK